MPRRKYGHMVHGLPQNPPPHKCRSCKNGYPCVIHDESERPKIPFNKMPKRKYRKLKLKKVKH
jgi:hypothetical protein